MQKNRLWIIIGALIIAIIGLVFWLSPKNEAAETTQKSMVSAADAGGSEAQLANADGSGAGFMSKSQQDTQINCQMTMDSTNRLVVNEQTRNCFEYFITQFGEKKLEQIQADFKTYISSTHTEPALSQVLDLWKRYIDYRSRLGQLQPPSGSNEDPRYYRDIFNSTQNLRKEFFSDYEIEGLFGTENTYHVYTLNRMDVIHNKNLTEAEKAKKLKALFDELPEDWKENLEQINKLEDLRKLTADIKARGGSAEEIRAMRMSLVGPEATQRLEVLDTQRADWKADVTGYLAERDSIIKSGMSDSAKQQAIQQLRNQHFQAKEDQLRLQTFETLHDQGQKLPFSD
ncbi:lipase secretion chaperone [Acinetobacter tianfuensis]|uniref:Lipase chaperone n=1 Tax=Acinetobacter tianfuensis TaxID=2419603 RepID=A0A3A8EBW7_9GAMM|nr:lipase secretion chaperone [Acinetobacter tianfuensis]RKG31628.1 lipase chaperone [Acinetobacter tianfuensis]